MRTIPHDLPSIRTALGEAEAAVADFFGSLTPDEFFMHVDAAWSAAEHLSHLNTSVSAVARGLSVSRLLLRLRFGRSARPAIPFDALREEYLGRLEGGAKARGPFVPEREAPEGPAMAARQAELLARWARVNGRLRTALDGWKEPQLDRLQLPHPLLGRIPVREMLFFTVHHNYHHVHGAAKRIPRLAAEEQRAGGA